MATGLHWDMTFEHLPIRRIDVDAPSRWLGNGWNDFKAAPRTALAHGGAFVLVSYFIVLSLNALGLGSLVPAVAAGFFLVAPILAVGLYDVSRRLEAGQVATFEDTVLAFLRNVPGLATMGLVLMLCMAVWMQVALLVFMLFFHATPPALDHFLYGILTAPQAVPFVIVGTLVGAVIAAAGFAISAISIPLLLDRDVPVLVAISTSVAAVTENWKVMIGWAATIVVLVGFGIVTGFIGLAVTLPLVGFGTWHAYRELVG